VSLDGPPALVTTESDTLVVDVRTPGEYETVHIPGAINLPLDQIDEHLAHLADTRILLICQSGARASRCQQTLSSAGLDGTLVLDGGIGAWLAVGHPVVRGRARWELDRQVRLAAGLLVASAVAVSIWWPRTRYLAGLIGVGLAAAAATNTCALGMLLSRLPYNQHVSGTTSTPNAPITQRTRSVSST
jgi:rhodanese-related sulfurtransferase